MKVFGLVGLVCGLLGFSLPASAMVYVLCEEEVYLVKDDGALELFTIYEADGAAADFEQAVRTANSRSHFTCRKAYSDHRFGDGFDCTASSSGVTTCGYRRVSGSYPRDPSLPAVPPKVRCEFKPNTCRVAPLPSP